MEDSFISKKDSWAHWAFFGGFVLILLLPILNLPPLFSPPAWGKTIPFRIILATLLGIATWLLVWKEKRISLIPYFKRFHPLFWPLSLLFSLVSIFFLATIFSPNPSFSFWGSPQRAWGFLNFLFYVLFALLLFVTVRNSDWRKLSLVAIAGGIFISFISLAQQFQFLGEGIVISYANRPPSTLGNPIFVAVYLLMLFFLAIPFFIQAKTVLLKSLYGSIL